MLSQANDVEEFANRRVEEIKRKNPKIQAAFRGIIYQKVSIIREIDTYDVFHEPTHKDSAHANLVRLKEYSEVQGEMSHSVIRELVSKLQWVKANSSELTNLLKHGLHQ
jgi:hypothetical protein